MYTYIFGIEVDLSKFSGPTKEIVDTVNKSMKEFGFDEKLIVRQVVSYYTISNPTELTRDQIEKIRGIANDHFRTTLPEYDIEVTGPTLKIG